MLFDVYIIYMLKCFELFTYVDTFGSSVSSVFCKWKVTFQKSTQKF